MKDFFKVASIEQVLSYSTGFPASGAEELLLLEADGRIIAFDFVSENDLPDFPRSTMDGYAIQAGSSFGASESNPAYLTIKGDVTMGKPPQFSIARGEAAGIPTGGMLPQGADSVVMIEHTEAVDTTMIEVFKSMAPGQNAIHAGEDFKKAGVVIEKGQKLRPQEIGLLAAFGKTSVIVHKKPVVAIISTGDEIVPIDKEPDTGQIRDINTYTLASMVRMAGGIPVLFGIVNDNLEQLFEKCSHALAHADMILISGGSSVGTRDFTIQALSRLPDAEILVHGISISPGKPTILARSGDKALWGLPGHVVSAMMVFTTVVRPFILHMGGLTQKHDKQFNVHATLARNVSSAQGRVDFVRVRLVRKNGIRLAHPVSGKSALINTMIKADGLIKIGINTEGLDKGTKVSVIPMV